MELLLWGILCGLLIGMGAIMTLYDIRDVKIIGWYLILLGIVTILTGVYVCNLGI